MKFRSFVVSVLAVASACSPNAAPDGSSPTEPTTRPPVTYHKDGTVETGDLKFASVEDFQQSADFVANGRRCASDREPKHVKAAPSDCSFSSTSIKGEYSPLDTLTIPVVFHIIQKTDGTGAIDDALIHSQIDILNEDFDAVAGSPGSGGNAGKIRFVLASTDAQGNPTTGILRVTDNSYFADPGSGLSPMKNALHWETSKYFNIYTNDANGALGYATFPSESAGEGEDGVVLLYTSVGRDAPQGGIYNQGRTATHEVGHYLGLFHSFQGGCGSANTPYGSGDLIKDTNAHASPNFECTAATSTCGSFALPIENYMNYTPDTCMTKFTVEQVNRMRCSIINYRAELVDVDTGTNQPPTANFTSTKNNLVVSFTDTSTDSDGTIASRAWTFDDGGTSTAANPSHTYAAAGTYTVTLTVKDNAGASSSKSQSVTVATGGGNPGGALTSGVAVPDLSGVKGAQLNYYIDVPANSKSVTFAISGGTGDADLYIKRGAAPTTTSYDSRPYLSGNNESVVVNNPAAARYYVMLRGFAAFSGVKLVATVVANTGGMGHVEEQPNLSATTGNARSFSIEVPAGATNLVFTTSGGTGDADLYVRKGSAPTTTTYDFRPYLDGNAESVTIASPAAAKYYVMVRAYASYSGVTLRVSYE
jgi:PKD repeat protein